MDALAFARATMLVVAKNGSKQTRADLIGDLTGDMGAFL
jgi:hypothetical protein